MITKISQREIVQCFKKMSANRLGEARQSIMRKPFTVSRKRKPRQQIKSLKIFKPQQ